jgi:ABC-2 type transport system permease protein
MMHARNARFGDEEVAYPGLANAFLPQAQGLEWTRNVSPFHWYLGGDPLINGVQWAGVGLLAGGTAIVLALGTLRFQRRDLGV